MDRPDDLLEEPLFVNGLFVRRWADLAPLLRIDAQGSAEPQPIGGLTVPQLGVADGFAWDAATAGG